MLARRRSLDHPTAGPIELPLLVPSFSSKGFGLHRFRQRGTEYSSVAFELEAFGRRQARSALISGYDLHFEHFHAPSERGRASWWDSRAF